MPETKSCKVRGCGRPAYARGYCQAHGRQLRTRGSIGPIRPYRQRRPGTEKFSGLRLSHQCVVQLEQKARREGLSDGAAIADILEEWARRHVGSRR